MSLLHQLTKITSRPSKRLGRGHGSGKGSHTVGRGTKGHKARKDGNTPVWFEGGQLPLIKRLPMWRGKGRFKVVRPVAEVSLDELNKVQQPEVTLETLKLSGIIPAEAKAAKVIATGKLAKAVNLQGVRTSAAAKAAIEQAGGSVVE